MLIVSVSERLGFSFTSNDMVKYFGKEPKSYMKKPFDIQTLLSTVKKLIGM